MKLQITVIGNKKVQRKLSMLQDLNRAGMEETIKRALEVIRDSSELNIRYGRPEWPHFESKEGLGMISGLSGLYDTGALAESMKTTYLSQGNKVTGVVYSDVEHSVFHELGTAGRHAVPPRPFLWPAFSDNQDRIVEIGKEEMQKAVKRVAR